MRIPAWKRWLSYLWEVRLERTSSDLNPQLNVSLVRGKFQLSTQNAIYSFDEAYDNFRLSFMTIDWDTFRCERVLVLGFGLGSIPLILQNVFHQKAEITAVELDEAVVELAVKYTIPRLTSPITWYLTDAATFVAQNEQQYDLICVDVFDNAQIPVACQTMEFLENCRRLLRYDGLIFYNCLAYTEADRQETSQFYEGTFKTIFPHATYKAVTGNHILIQDGRKVKLQSTDSHK